MRLPGLFILCFIITLLSLTIYTSAPGLHYVLIYYSSGFLVLLALINSATIYKSVENKLVFRTTIISAVLIALPIVIDGNVNAVTVKFGLYLTILCLLFQLIVLIKINKTKKNIS